MTSSATDVVSTPIPSTVSVTFVNLFRGRKQRYLGYRSIDSGTSTTHRDKSAADKRLVDIIWYCWFNSHKCTVRTSELSAPTECLQLRLFLYHRLLYCCNSVCDASAYILCHTRVKQPTHDYRNASKYTSRSTSAPPSQGRNCATRRALLPATHLKQGSAWHGDSVPCCGRTRRLPPHACCR